jgi:hypothetical protein
MRERAPVSDREPITSSSMRELAVMITIAGVAACAAPSSELADSATDTAAARAEAERREAGEGFDALQERGAVGMGVDQYSSEHVFERSPNGGRIALWRDVDDSAGVETIRAHMRDIAARFSAGDFSIPAFVHGGAVPGADAMARHRDAIRYVAEDIPRGGAVRITSSDSVAVAAIHAFLAFQSTAHHTADGDHAGH